MPRSAPLLRRSAALLFAGALATLTGCGSSDDGADAAASPTSSSAAASSSASRPVPSGEVSSMISTSAAGTA